MQLPVTNIRPTGESQCALSALVRRAIHYGEAFLLAARRRHHNLEPRVSTTSLRASFAVVVCVCVCLCVYVVCVRELCVFAFVCAQTFSSGETPNLRSKSDFSGESGAPNLASMRGTDTATDSEHSE